METPADGCPDSSPPQPTFCSPKSFQVSLKSGTKRSYGGAAETTFSRLEGRAIRTPNLGSPPSTIERPVVLAWGLDREEDRSGNYLTVTYSLTHPTLPEGTTTEWHPLR